MHGNGFRKNSGQHGKWNLYILPSCMTLFYTLSTCKHTYKEPQLIEIGWFG
jgi:hypothetical protein